MAAEIEWFGAGRPRPADARRRCRFCARVLQTGPQTPAEIEPHCAAGGCPVCAECAVGATLVSPVRPGRPRIS